MKIQTNNQFEKLMGFIFAFSVIFNLLTDASTRTKNKSFDFEPQAYQLADFHEHFKHDQKPQSHAFGRMYFSFKEGLSAFYDLVSCHGHDNHGLRQALLYGSSDLTKVINYLVYARTDRMAPKFVLNANSLIGSEIEQTKNNIAMLFNKITIAINDKNKILIILQDIDQCLNDLRDKQQAKDVFFDYIENQLAQLRNKDVLVVYTAKDLSQLNENFLNKMAIRAPFDDLKERTFYFEKNLARDTRPIFNKGEFDKTAAKFLLILSEGKHDLALEHFNGIKSGLLEIDRLLNNFYAQSREYNLAVAAKISSLCKDIDARRITMSDYIKTGIFADYLVGIVSDCNQCYARFIEHYLSEVANYLFKEYYNPTPEALQYLIDNTADLDYIAIDELMKQCSLRDGAYVFTLEFIKEKIKTVKSMQDKGQFCWKYKVYDTLDKIATIQPNIPAVFRMDESKKVTVKEVKKKQRRSELFKTEKEILFIVSGIVLIGFTCDSLCKWIKKKFAKKKDTPLLESELKTNKA